MEFDVQINKFLQLTDRIHISSHAQCLYLQLLQAFRLHIFPEELSIDNMSIIHVTRLSRHQLTDARSELQKLSLIDYTPGSGSASGKYKLINLAQAKLKLIEDISQFNSDEITDLKELREQVNKLQGDYKIWGNFVLNVLHKAVQKDAKGVYSGHYVTTQRFLKAKNLMTYDTIFKLITTLMYKNDINNKEAYILACVANTVESFKVVY